MRLSKSNRSSSGTHGSLRTNDLQTQGLGLRIWDPGRLASRFNRPRLCKVICCSQDRQAEACGAKAGGVRPRAALRLLPLWIPPQPLLLERGQSLRKGISFSPLDDSMPLLGALRAPFFSCPLLPNSIFCPALQSGRSSAPSPGDGPPCWSLCLTFQDGDVDLWHRDGLVHGSTRVTAAKAPGCGGLLFLPGAVFFMLFFIPKGVKTSP